MWSIIIIKANNRSFGRTVLCPNQRFDHYSAQRTTFCSLFSIIFVVNVFHFYFWTYSSMPSLPPPLSTSLYYGSYGSFHLISLVSIFRWFLINSFLNNLVFDPHFRFLFHAFFSLFSSLLSLSPRFRRSVSGTRRSNKRSSTKWCATIKIFCSRLTHSAHSNTYLNMKIRH